MDAAAAVGVPQVDAAAAADAPPRHHPDTWRNVLLFMAASGFTHEAARATVTTPDLRHDPELLARIARVASRGSRETLLSRAIARDDVARAAELLAACPTPEFRAEVLAAHEAAHEAPQYGLTCLFGNSAAMVRCLLDAGASTTAVNAKTIRAYVSRDFTAALAELLPALGPAEVRRRLVCDGLEWAQSGAMARLLIELGANTHGDGWQTAFSSAIYRNSSEVLEVLLAALGSDGARREEVNRMDDDRRTPIMHVTSNEVALALVAAGADVSTVDAQGRDAVWQAVYRRAHSNHDDNDPTFPAIVSTLLAALGSDDARRASVNRADDEGVTALMRNTSIHLAQALLAAGADASKVDRHGRDAVWHAAERWRYFAVSTLLAALGSDDARRASVTRADKDGVTALMRAGNVDTAQALLAAGADVGAVDARGRDAVWYAAAWSFPPLVSTLLAALDSDDARRATALRADDEGVTALMCVRRSEDADALLAAGADASAVDGNGRDAVAYASELSYFFNDGFISTLLAGMASDDERRASANRMDQQGRTPLMNAKHGGDIRALLAAGADVQRLDLAARTDEARQVPEGDLDLYYDEWAEALPDVLMALGPEQRKHELRSLSLDFLRLAAWVDGIPEWEDSRGASCAQRLLDLGADVRATDAAGHDVFWEAKTYSSNVLRVLLGALGSDEERRGVMQRPDMVAAGVEYPPPLTESA